MSRLFVTRRDIIITTFCAATLFSAGNAQADGEEPMLTIRGELSYRQRIALPPDAVAFVEIKASDADDAAQAVAQTRINLNGQQVPVSFSLELPRAHLEGSVSYLLSGGILVEDQVTWHVAEPVSVETSTDQFNAGMLMMTQQEVAEPDEQGSLIGEWRILKVGDDTLDAQENATLSFADDGGFSGRLCNSFRGSYTISDATISFGQTAATLMACPEPLASQEHALFSAFESAATFTIAKDGTLNLMNDEGKVLMSAQR